MTTTTFGADPLRTEPVFARAARGVFGFFASLHAAQAAAHEFDRLNARSDADLARAGESREAASRAIMERYFG